MLDAVFPTLEDQRLPIFKEYEQIVLSNPTAASPNPISSSYDPSPLLNVSGLENEKSLLAVFLGRFWLLRGKGSDGLENAGYKTRGWVKVFFHGFIAAYSERCHKYLPTDAKTYQHIKTIYVGTEDTGYKETTNYYKEVPGLLVTMRPQYYSVYVGKGSRKFFPIWRIAKDKASKLIDRHGCQSLALRQFEDNLFLIASGRLSHVEAIGSFDPGEAALPQFLAYADRLNIPHSDITQAMFRGEFNPHFDEISRVYLEMTIEELRKQGGDWKTAANSYEHARENWVKSVSASENWIKRFGELSDQQLFRGLQRGSNNPLFKSEEGWTISKALATAKVSGNEDQFLWEMAKARKSTSSWDYFRGGEAALRQYDPLNFKVSLENNDDFVPRVEYERLRKKFVSRLPDRYFKR